MLITSSPFQKWKTGEGNKVNIGHLVRERLKILPKYKGCICGQVIENADYVEFPILGAVSSEGFGVKVTFLLQDGFIEKVICSSGNEKVEKEVDSVGLDNFNQALKMMVELLDRTAWGSEDWILFCDMEYRELPEHLVACVQKKGKRLKIPRTLVDFGFSEIFCTVTFAKDASSFYALLEENQKAYFLAEFESAEEGNAFYQEVKKHYFISKKGNKIYKISKNQFYEKFCMVKGVLYEGN